MEEQLKEAISIIQVYIHIHKNVQVDIRPVMPRDMQSIALAFEKARSFFAAANIKITMLDTHHGRTKNWRRYN